MPIEILPPSLKIMARIKEAATVKLKEGVSIRCPRLILSFAPSPKKTKLVALSSYSDFLEKKKQIQENESVIEGLIDRIEELESKL